ncbi:MAG: hypothetical protein LBE22_12185 [Azoarcus sp.]|jgi:hypothetical protein|nr:hypothetical protein [Azoarcus sp.]
MTTGNPYTAPAAEIDNGETKPPKLTPMGLIIAIIAALFLCLIIGLNFSEPSDLSPELLSNPCRRYTSDFLAGSSICVLAFIFITFVFRKQNKLLLTATIIPSIFFGFYLITSGMKSDHHISSYGWLAKNCHIPTGIYHILNDL